MLTNCLSRTRNHLWVPNRLTTQRYSTADRLDLALGKSMIVGYIGLAYNTGSVLLLNDIVADLEYEINDIRSSQIRAEGVYESNNDGSDISVEYIQNVLSICDILIGKVKSSTDLMLEQYIKDPFYLAIAEYYNMVYKKIEGVDTLKSIDNVFIKTLMRSGMSIYSIAQPNDDMRAVIMLDSMKLREGFNKPNIIDFMSSTTFLNASSDNYMCWLAGLCVEPDSNMINGPTTPLSFVKRWFSSASMDETIHAIASGDCVKLAAETTPHLRFVTQFLVNLKDRQNIRLGQATNTVLKSALTGRNYIDKDIAYVLELLTAKDAPAKDDSEFIEQECIDAFKASELYLPTLDVTSEAYIEVSAAKEDDPEEDPAEEDPEEDPVEDPEEEPGEEDPDEETDPEEDPIEEDPEADPMEEDTSAGKVSDTSDSKGMTISVQEGKGTLDEYLYRRELGFLISELLENPPEKMSADKLAILKDIKYRWLYIFDVDTLHKTLSKIIDLKIKVKTEVAA